ncbi:MAG: hypothetical protein AAGH45_00315 [Pseudomonadota bacterium]
MLRMIQQSVWMGALLAVIGFVALPASAAEPVEPVLKASVTGASDLYEAGMRDDLDRFLEGLFAQTKSGDPAMTVAFGTKNEGDACPAPPACNLIGHKACNTRQLENGCVTWDCCP